MKERTITRVATDVLILGGGSAGIWAARQAKLEHPELDVLIVDKAAQDWGGLMSLSGGDLEVTMPGEDPGEWVQDLVYYWDGLCDQLMMREIWEDSHNVFSTYQDLGLEFFDLPEGGYRSVPQRNLPHIRLYPYKYKGTGGAAMRDALVGEMNRLGVRRMGRIFITEFLKRDSRVCGAFGFNLVTGEAYEFQCACVVNASGSPSYKPTYNNNTCTGESILAAFRAGASLRNFEFLNIWNVPRQFAWEGQTVLMPLGAKFVNRFGTPVMEPYSPVLGSNTDPHYLTRAMALEISQGRGPITLDMSAIREEDRILIRPQTGSQLLHYNKLMEEGIQFFTDPLEWIPQIQMVIGAIDADVQGRTGVDGLFAAGRCRSLDPGVYMGGFALTTTAVTGRKAGAAAAEYACGSDRPEPDWDPALQAAQVMDRIGREGSSAHDVLRQLQTLMAPYDVTILKTREGLERAQKGLDTLAAEVLPRLGSESPHYLAKALEVEAIAEISRLYVTASLFRTDSRAGHYRQDYPDRYEDWLCWVILHNEDGQAVPHRQPVPVEQYPYPVTGYYRDNFTF